VSESGTGERLQGYVKREVTVYCPVVFTQHLVYFFKTENEAFSTTLKNPELLQLASLIPE